MAPGTSLIHFLDRLGGAKADRRKEAAISTAVETYLRNHQSERADGRMSRGKMVLFFKFCFPLFLEIVLKVIRQETTKGKTKTWTTLTRKSSSKDQSCMGVKN